MSAAGPDETHFLFRWRKALRESDLPSSARLIAHTMSDYMDLKGRGAHPGYRRLAKECGLSQDTIAVHLPKLVGLGWLVEVAPAVMGSRGLKAKAAEYAAADPAAQDAGALRPPERSDSPTGALRSSGQSAQVTGAQLSMNSPSNSPSRPTAKSKRGSQVPEDFAVTTEMRHWCAENSIRSNPDIETPKFIDHHGSRGSTFRDHTAAWRNWMRRADDFAKPQTEQRSKSMANADRVLATLGLEAGEQEAIA